MRVERAFRGISPRLVRHYLENLGGEVVDDTRVEGEGWTATFETDTVEIGPSITLTEITIVFEGEEDVLDDLVERFAQKAMRAGG